MRARALSHLLLELRQLSSFADDPVERGGSLWHIEAMTRELMHRNRRCECPRNASRLQINRTRLLECSLCKFILLPIKLDCGLLHERTPMRLPNVESRHGWEESPPS